MKNGTFEVSKATIILKKLYLFFEIEKIQNNSASERDENQNLLLIINLSKNDVVKIIEVLLGDIISRERSLSHKSEFPVQRKIHFVYTSMILEIILALLNNLIMVKEKEKAICVINLCKEINSEIEK